MPSRRWTCRILAPPNFVCLFLFPRRMRDPPDAVDVKLESLKIHVTASHGHVALLLYDEDGGNSLSHARLEHVDAL